MKIPKIIKIGGHNFKITRGHAHGLGGANAGVKEIVIAPDESFTESTTSETLLHEIIELIAIQYDLNVRSDHTQITVLSEVLFSVMRDNKLDFSKEDTK